VAGLQQAAEFARFRNALGSIVITALALLSFYTLALSFLPRFESDLAVNFVLSPIIIIFFHLTIDDRRLAAVIHATCAVLTIMVWIIHVYAATDGGRRSLAITASYSPACNRAGSARSIADGSVTFLRSHLQ
jgi:uncharacterized membrane protein